MTGFSLRQALLRGFFTVAAIIFISAVSGCAGMAASAEEYFSIGMAYYDLGKFDEAEKWLNRAKSADKTMIASQYNLGRIAFETERYEDAARYFESILKRDPDNVLALKAAAFTRIKTGDIPLAEKHYSHLLELVPESADDGYNHALVLYALKRYGDAEKTLEKYPFALTDNSEMTLLYARCQKALDKVEAIDSFAKWLDGNTDNKVRYEYAQLLEQHELYARALEEYRKTIAETAVDSADPVRGDVRFALARVLLIADSENSEGITELEIAVGEGFNDIEAVEKLQKSGKLSAGNKDQLRTVINDMQRRAEQKHEEENPETSD
ncbi:MAG: tetratricopeptide repeat protein [Treponema sp.]|jgi:tetratricopeptide (TPR) repeat protein|nr:tetratricopeptide repeat protein [Treponema sp.]